MSENNRPDSEQKKDQTTAEDILAQVDSILADLENSAVAQLFAAPEKPKPEENKKLPEKEESAPPGEPEPPDKNAEQLPAVLHSCPAAQARRAALILLFQAVFYSLRV